MKFPFWIESIVENISFLFYKSLHRVITIYDNLSLLFLENEIHFRNRKLCFPYHSIGYDEVLVSLQYLSEVGQLWIIYGCI